MNELGTILYSEQDIEYYKRMSEGELQETMEQMLKVGHRIAENHSFLQNAPWYKRALSTISGKTKRTQKEIATDHAIISVYCVQVIKEFVNRGLITQEKVNVLEGKVNELYNQFTRLVQVTGTAVNAIDDYNTFNLALQIGYYSDTLISALQIASTIHRLSDQTEKFQIILGAIKKYITTTPKTVAERLLEIQNASSDDLIFLKKFVDQSNNNIAKCIRICLKLRDADCLDETGVLKAMEAAELINSKNTIDEFIGYIVRM